MEQVNFLRPVVQRLNTTPVHELPKIASFLASTITACSSLLQTTSGPRSEEILLLVHKLKTKISSLLQDRTPEGRLTAIILIKALIEAGGQDTLIAAGPWVRGLIGILNKPDSPAAKRLCITTITRIFSLTHNQPTLLREITTPLLPPFITACLNVIRPKTVKAGEASSVILSPLLEPVLHSWIQLLPQAPATFRPFVTRFQPICLSLIGEEPTWYKYAELARKLLVLLPTCAPKNGSATRWSQMVQDIVLAANKTADGTFEAVVEDWVPLDPNLKHRQSALADQSSGLTSDALILPQWFGLHKGCLRLSSLISLLGDFMSSETAQPVTVPINLILDLLLRVLSVPVPSISKDSKHGIKLNQHVGRDEREALWTQLPFLHVSCFRVLRLMIDTFRMAIMPACRLILRQLCWVFEIESWHTDIREAMYKLLGALLPIIGPSLMKEEVKSIAPLIHSCCRDLVAQVTSNGSQAVSASTYPTSGANGSAGNFADSFIGPDKRANRIVPKLEISVIHRTADGLLPKFLTYLDVRVLPQPSRAEIDRTAILINQKRAMLASLLAPYPTQSKAKPTSIIPFLAQIGSRDPHFESIIRPRMPSTKERFDTTTDLSSPNGVDSNMLDDGSDSDQSDVKGVDLLSQLEHSLQNGGGGVADIGSQGPSDPTMRQEGNDTGLLPETPSSSLKRDFESINQTGNEIYAKDGANLHVALEPEERAKRLRGEGETYPATGVSESSNANIASMEVQEIDNDEIRKYPEPRDLFDGNSRIDRSLSGNRETLTVQETRTAETLAVDEVEDYDSSDSEIPKINVELDTEDEDDHDDDMASESE